MKQRSVLSALSVVFALTSLAAVSGCKADTSMSKEEEANFKGGPMPADYNPGVTAGPGAAAAPNPAKQAPK